MHYSIRLISLGLTLFVILGCRDDQNQHKQENNNHIFEINDWQMEDGLDYPYRDLMLEDLMANHKLKHLSQSGIIQLLGSPNRKDGNYLFYTIHQKRIGLWPIHTKTLVIKTSTGDTLNQIMIHE